MKTTIDIPDSLFDEAKACAAKRRVSLREIFETALRSYLKTAKPARRGFKLMDGSVGGSGVLPGVREGDWGHISELIYEGRGG